MSLGLFSLALDYPTIMNYFGSRVETSTRTKLNEVRIAFNRKELTKSTNLFLKSWHILQSEYNSNLYKLD